MFLVLVSSPICSGLQIVKQLQKFDTSSLVDLLPQILLWIKHPYFQLGRLAGLSNCCHAHSSTFKEIVTVLGLMDFSLVFYICYCSDLNSLICNIIHVSR